jgi:hypothetical protein
MSTMNNYKSVNPISQTATKLQAKIIAVLSLLNETPIKYSDALKLTIRQADDKILNLKMEINQKTINDYEKIGMQAHPSELYQLEGR